MKTNNLFNGSQDLEVTLLCRDRKYPFTISRYIYNTAHQYLQLSADSPFTGSSTKILSGKADQGSVSIKLLRIGASCCRSAPMTAPTGLQSVPPFQEFPVKADRTFLDDMNFYVIIELQVGARVFSFCFWHCPWWHAWMSLLYKSSHQEIPIKINKTGFRVLVITPKDICAVTAARGLDS